MRDKFLLTGAIATFSFLTAGAGNPPSSTGIPLRGNGLGFTENKGQVVDMAGKQHPEIYFKGEGNGTDFYIFKNGFSYVVSNVAQLENELAAAAGNAPGLSPGDNKNLLNNLANLRSDKNRITRYHRVDVMFEGSNPDAWIEKTDKVEGYSNYYLSSCPKGITHVNSYNEIDVNNIYSNVNLRYYGKKDQGLEYDLIVNPGGAPENIKMKYNGASNIKLREGKLVVETSLEELGEYMPKVYQESNGKRIEVTASYNLSKENEITFSLGQYDPKKPLIIDPWVTYYGGPGGGAAAVNTDLLGYGIFTGYTTLANFPVTSGALQTTLNGATNSYIIKMTPTGTRDWATYFGGSDEDVALGVFSDSTYNILISGFTYSTDLPVNNPAPGNVVWQNTNGGGSQARDAFVLKMDSSGTLLWATYFGGSGQEDGHDITADGQGNVYLTGFTTSTNAIASAGAFQGSLKGGAGDQDAYFAKFEKNGTFVWGSYAGSSEPDAGTGIACDNRGYVYGGGTTSSSNFPATAGTYQPHYAGGNDGFIIKITPNGAIDWCTYYGGTSTEWGNAIAVDSKGNVFLDGITSSTTGIASAGAFQTAVYTGAPGTAFVVKIDSSGKTRDWGTYIGGKTLVSGWISATCMEVFGLACDASDNVVVAGDDYFIDLPTTSCAYQSKFIGTEDQFFASFDPNGNNLCLGYLGHGNSSSPNNETGLGYGSGGIIAISGCSFLLAAESDCDYPVTSDAFQTTCTGGTNGNTTPSFARLYTSTCGGITPPVITFSAPTLTVVGNQADACKGQMINFAPGNPGSCSDTAGAAYFWAFSGGTPKTSMLKSPTILFDSTGTFDFMLVIKTTCWADTLFKPQYINVAAPVLIPNQVNDVCLGDSSGIVSVSASGNSPFTYSWSPGGSSKDTLTGLKAGKYKVTVTDKRGCQTIDSVNLTTNQSTPVVASFTASPAGSISAGTTVQFTNKSTGAKNWLWNFGDTASGGANSSTMENPSHLFSGAEKYCVVLVAIDSLNCSKTDTVCIEATQTSITIPNIFSPNGDNVNDQFVITTKGIESLNFKIYDRWGLLIYQGESVSSAWDGRTGSDGLAPDGTYYIMYDAVSYTGKTFKGAGFVQLVRNKN